ncbi:Uncharacterized acetyltransferase At3g50280 [Linum perenne]
MLSCHYIQKGALFSKPQFPFSSLCLLLKSSLSHTLSLFPPLAGRLTTDSSTAEVYISCNDAGVDFLHASAPSISIIDILGSVRGPDFVNGFFALDRTVSYQGHHLPILSVQVTELADGVFIGCSVNHSVTDGTSFWNFFNCFAQVSRGVKCISRLPDFSRDSPLMSSAVLRLPQGGPRVTFDETAPLSERIFSFTREAVLKLKATVNNSNNNSKISSFQSLCALVWRAVTRARKLNSSKTTTFRMAVNCRHRLSPKMDPLYFGNAIQSIPTYASAGDVTSRELRWLAERLNENVSAGNLDGASMTMGSSPRFPMYDNDFGWGRPLAVRSGKANKFDGKMSAFPGREGGGTVDLEVVLAPETMAAIEADKEFMQFVSSS